MADYDYSRVAQAMMPTPDPDALAARLNYFGNLPEREANLDPKERSLAVASNFLGLMPYARAAELARERGEGSFLWNLVNTGTSQKEAERRALQQYYNDAYETAPDSMKVLSGIGLPFGAAAGAAKMLPMASAPIRSSAGLGAGMAGIAGYASPIGPDTGDFKARLPSALDSARYGALIGALGAGGAKFAQSPSNALSSARNWIAENAPGPNQLNIFAGPKAKTADQHALAMANEMHAAGETPRSIWDRTGWFQGADGKWKFEIPDINASIGPTSNRLNYKGETTPIQEFSTFVHPELNAAYGKQPSLFGLYGEGIPYTGGYNSTHPKIKIQVRSPTPEEAKSAALHEHQHWLQDKEGFAQGASPQSAWDAMEAKTPSLYNGYDPKVAEALYRAHAGEVEARNVQKRMNMTPEERRLTPPWETEDIPRDMQIVRFGNNGVAESRSGDSGYKLEPNRELNAKSNQRLFYDINDNEGNQVGHIVGMQRIDRPNILDIDSIGLGEGISRDNSLKNTLGTGTVRDLLIQLQQYHPDITHVSGFRGTGANPRRQVTAPLSRLTKAISPDEP